MEFDMASFVIGILTAMTVAMIYVGIVQTVERQRKEREEWVRTMFE